VGDKPVWRISLKSGMSKGEKREVLQVGRGGERISVYQRKGLEGEINLSGGTVSAQGQRDARRPREELERERLGGKSHVPFEKDGLSESRYGRVRLRERNRLLGKRGPNGG